MVFMANPLRSSEHAWAALPMKSLVKENYVPSLSAEWPADGLLDTGSEVVLIRYAL